MHNIVRMRAPSPGSTGSIGSLVATDCSGKGVDCLEEATMPIAIVGMSCRFPGGATTPRNCGNCVQRQGALGQRYLQTDITRKPFTTPKAKSSALSVFTVRCHLIRVCCIDLA